MNQLVSETKRDLNSNLLTKLKSTLTEWNIKTLIKPTRNKLIDYPLQNQFES